MEDENVSNVTMDLVPFVKKPNVTADGWKEHYEAFDAVAKRMITNGDRQGSAELLLAFLSLGTP